MLISMLQGLSMSLADSVPGVSGGTIAFILGFYEKFLGALHDLIGKDRNLRRSAFLYLLKFSAGWAVGMISCVMILSKAFENNIYFLSSLFLGFTVSAIPLIIYEERETLRGKYRWIIYTVLGVLAVVALALQRTSDIGAGTVDFTNLSLLQYAYLTVTGVAAVSAMLLPGISGSTLLLIFGVYVQAVNALKEVVQFHMIYLPGVLALGTGILCGIFFAAGLIRKGLRTFRPQMVYLIIVLMIGSLYAIVMGPATLDMPKAPLSAASFDMAAFLLGIAIPAGLEFARYKIKRIKDRSEIENAPSPSESEESQSEKCDISGGQDDAKPDNSCETENNDANQGEE